MRIKTEKYTEVDNFDEISDLLFKKEPLGKGEFYFLQILVRGKDGNKVSGNNKNRLVKYYTVFSEDNLREIKNEVIGICKVVNGRAYIHPSKRNEKEVANLVLETTARSFVCENWIGLKSTFSTSCGKSYIKSDRKYVVDLDDIEKGSDEYEKIKSFINTLKGKGDDKIVGGIETAHGCHLITHPFDVAEFKKVYPDIDIHKNSPTLLYYYKEETK